MNEWIVRINVLECTLRAGDYINEWSFSNANISKKIIGLSESSVPEFNVDILEYISLKSEFNNKSLVVILIQRFLKRFHLLVRVYIYE